MRRPPRSEPALPLLHDLLLAEKVIFIQRIQSHSGYGRRNACAELFHICRAVQDHLKLPNIQRNRIVDKRGNGLTNAVKCCNLGPQFIQNPVELLNLLGFGVIWSRVKRGAQEAR